MKIELPDFLYERLRLIGERMGYPDTSEFGRILIESVCCELENQRKPDLTMKDEKEISKRLKDLGYLG